MPVSSCVLNKVRVITGEEKEEKRGDGDLKERFVDPSLERKKLPVAEMGVWMVGSPY